MSVYDQDPALKMEDDAVALAIEGKWARLREILIQAEIRVNKIEELGTKYMKIGGDAFLQFESFYKVATREYDEVGRDYRELCEEQEAHKKWRQLSRAERISLLEDVLLSDALTLVSTGMKNGLGALGKELDMSATRKIDRDLLDDIDALVNEIQDEYEEARKRILEQPYVLYYAMSLPKASG